MPKSKSRKEHKSKVANRNKKIKDQSATIEKMKMRFLNDLIKREQESGAFNDTCNINNEESTPMQIGEDNLIVGPQI